MRNPNRLHRAAVSWAAIGSLVVFGGVVLVNQFAKAPEPESRLSSRSLELARRQAPPPQARPQPKPKPKPRRLRAAPPPPLAGLSGGLSGVDLGLNLGLWDLGAVDQSLLGDNSDVVMTSETVDLVPRPRRRTAMPYPPLARAQGIEGYVLVSLLIDAAGGVRDARVVESQPAGIFDDLVLTNIKLWEFSPAEYKGEKVKVWANQRVRFDLG